MKISGRKAFKARLVYGPLYQDWSADVFKTCFISHLLHVKLWSPYLFLSLLHVLPSVTKVGESFDVLLPIGLLPSN
jgi:hypothetical protein